MLADAQRWLSMQAGAEADFVRALEDPEVAQVAKLRTYLRQNAETSFGRAHDFGSVADYREFIAAVPVRDFVGLSPWIDQIGAGRERVLTTEPVLAMEETSGSGGAKKWIPVTASLRSEFEGAVSAWLRDLSQQYPQAFGGRSYWSISPPLKPRGHTPGGLRIGSENDLAFFSEESASLLGGLMAVAPDICRIRDADAFWTATAEGLIACTDLALISVWSPNFFLTLDRVLQDHLGTKNFVWSDLWPGLALLSCWADAQSAMWMPDVEKRLGDVPVQGKGLLATEGVTTVPFARWSVDPTIALTAHFFEFRERESEMIVLAHELVRDREYEVILTTGGGLYRYATGDVVRACGELSLRFVGRAGRFSDLVGEKLDEAQVTVALAGVDGARFLSAESDPSAAGYRLYLVEGTRAPERGAASVQTNLERNAYYRQAVNLGQLRPIDIGYLSVTDLREVLERLASQMDAKLGDVKVPSLFRLGELDELLSPHV